MWACMRLARPDVVRSQLGPTSGWKAPVLCALDELASLGWKLGAPPAEHNQINLKTLRVKDPVAQRAKS